MADHNGYDKGLDFLYTSLEAGLHVECYQEEIHYTMTAH